MFETKTRTEVATAEIERYRAARKRVNEIGTSERIGENYWGAVQHCDVIREIAAADVKACFKRISLARAREIVIFCAADQRATIADAAAQLGYRNVQTTEATAEPVSMLLAIAGGVNVHWGNDGHTACGFDGAEQVTNPMYTEPDCHTCWTVWAVTAN